MTDRVEQGEDGQPVFLFSHPTFEENASKLRRELMWDWYLMAQVRKPPLPMKIIITGIT